MQRLMNFGGFPQRLMWASTGTKDPNISDVLYVNYRIAPYEVNTVPKNTLLALADHGTVGDSMRDTTAEADQFLQQFAEMSVDYLKLAAQLQQEGAGSFNKS